MLLLIVLTVLATKVLSLGATTDTYTWGGDYLRHGYQTNHNMDPSVVGTSNFGQIFKTQLPGNFRGIGAEQVFSQPLVFTGNDGIQYLFVATTQNNIYKLNAKTGAIIASRSLHVPFLTADLDGCADINPTIGITGTGTIDPETGIWYLSSKTYSEQFQSGLFSPSNPPGRDNGRYYFHGIDTQSPGFVDAFSPVTFEGRTFRNNPNRMFTAGIHLQRPGLVVAGDYVYTAYGSHCVKWNLTGSIVGHNKRTGAVVEMYATQGGPEPNSIPGGGIWMSGGGITYDGAGSIFFTTGNGYASQLSNTPVPGRQPPSALEEAAVNAKINEDGTIRIVDFFMPWEKQQLDGADKDLGTTPLQILPTDVFTCPNVRRMGVVTGKSGKTYVLNLDNLGGYQMAFNRLDNIVFTYQHENSVYAGAGVMPLGGGYIYINVVRYQTRVFRFSCDGRGNPQFTVAGYTKEMNAYILGTGHGTTTSLNGRDGTGLYWVSDIEGLNLRIYDAIPPVAGGNLALVNSFNAPGITKFTRPVFGDGTAYLGTVTGALYGFGSPVNLPLNCSSPYDFGRIAIKNSPAASMVTCTANIATTIIGVGLAGNENFNLSSLPTSNLQLAKGASFSFQAVFSPQSVGPLSSDAIVNTTNSVAGYTTSTPVILKGIGSSSAPLLAIAPNTVSFNTIAGEQVGGVNQSSIFSNRGDSILTIRNVSYSLRSEKGPWVTPNITAAGIQIGPFTFTGVPGSIAANGQSTVAINYNPASAGNDACFLSVNSDGGTAILDVVAVAATYPQAVIEFEKFDGTGWTRLDNSSTFTFGNVTENQTRNLRLRVSNNGSASAAPLSITVSKPPFGLPGIVGAVNNIDLAEGTIIAAGQSATATLYCSVPKSQYNVPAYPGSAEWTMNTGDIALGKQTMKFACTAVAEQVGPLFTNGSARFGYVGCYKENNPGRQLAIQTYGDSSNTIERCVNACSSAGWYFAATQYHSECWCGNAVPRQRDNEADCNYQCSGDGNQTCGGNGYFADGSRMSLFADLTRYQNVTSPPLAIPQTVGPYKYIGCYRQSGGKAMNAKGTADPKLMSVSKCADFCTGFNAFSVEYGQECYCGAGVNTQFAILTSDSSCMTMTCKGNNSEYCGAGNLAQVYAIDGSRPSSPASSSIPSRTVSVSISSAAPTPSQALTDWTYLGCYNETHDRRALNEKEQDVRTNTLNSCAAFCQGFNYFGVEYASQCFCGNALYSNSIKQATESGCSIPCAGNSSQTCGGADFLNVYYTNATTLPPSTSAPGQSAPTPTGGPSAVASAGGFSYIGCYNEVGGRALVGRAVANSSMTVDLCAAFCSSFQFFGVEYSSECFCGDTIATGSVAGAGSCTMPCAADPNQYCGGPALLSMYQKNASVPISSALPSGLASRVLLSRSSVLSLGLSSLGSFASSTIRASPTSSIPPSSSASPSSSSVPARIGNHTALGCYTDNAGGVRALPNLFADDSMTLDLCASRAQANSAQYFGASYGRECWYGPGPIAGSNAPAAQASCNMRCPGNQIQWCGAGNFLQLYSFSLAATPSPATTSSLASSTSLIASSRSQQASIRPSTSSSAISTVATLSSIGPSSVLRAGTSSESLAVSSTLSSSSRASVGSSSFVSNAASSASSGLSSRSVVSSSSAPAPTSSPIMSTATLTSSSTRQSSSSPSSSPSTSRSLGSSAPGISSSTSSRPPSLVASSLTSSRESSSGLTSARSSSIGQSLSVSPSSSSGLRPSLSIALTTSSARSSSSTSPSAVPTIGSYSHLGCYNEISGRALNATSLKDGQPMTVARCADFCTKYAYFGLQYSAECYCGAYPRPGSARVTNQAECNSLCSGDRGIFCGGPNRLNVYFSSEEGKVDHDPLSAQLVGNYRFYNCVSDSSRLLTSRLSTSPNMTVKMCTDLAEQAELRYAGTEYGVECWAGNDLRTPLMNATGCNMVCGGDVGELCGGGSRLSLYSRI